LKADGVQNGYMSRNNHGKGKGEIEWAFTSRK